MTPLKSGQYVFNPESIKIIRERLNLSQEQLANKIGAVKAAISRWENGKVTPDADSLAAIYSVAKEGRIDSQFFKLKVTNRKGGRSNLFVSWDYQNIPLSAYIAGDKAKSIIDELSKRFPTVSHSVFKVFASSVHRSATNEMAKQGWRLQEFDRDIDDELDSQGWGDCNQAPQDTIFVLITRDGDFVDLIEDLRKKGIRVYLMAPENTSIKLMEAVGKKNCIPFPSENILGTLNNYLKL